MSHYCIVVIVDGETEPAYIEREVERLLAPFDENMEVAPYKEYMSDEDIARMVRHYTEHPMAAPPVDPNDLTTLLPYMEDWNGSEGAIDGGGLYYLRTYNPQSKWDWWSVGGRYSGRITGDPGQDIVRVSEMKPGDLVTHEYDFIGNPIRELEKHEQYYSHCYGILTKEGEWISQGRMGWFGMSDDAHDSVEWSKRYFEILSSYPNDWAVLVDCHI